MADPFVLRERWFDVSALEFKAFLRDRGAEVVAISISRHRGRV
jgi:hypothetical protein